MLWLSKILKHLILFDVPLSNINVMGKGDIKSKKGKITNGSFGKRRPHKVAKKAETIQKQKTETGSA